MKNSIITKKHLESVGSFLNTVRFQKNPRGSLAGVSALQEVTEALELALEILKFDGELTKELSEVGGIRPSTMMNFTFHFDDIELLKSKSDRARALIVGLKPAARKFLKLELEELKDLRRHRANTICLDKSIFLKGRKRNGIQCLNLSIEQVDDVKAEVIVRIGVVNSKSVVVPCFDWSVSSLPKNGLTASTIAKSAAREWSKWLKKKRIDW